MLSISVSKPPHARKGKFHDQFFRRKAQNLRAEIVLGMRIENLIFATKKNALRQ